MADEQLSGYLKYPTGSIPKGSFCECCNKYNTRNVTCCIVLMNNRNEVLLIKRDTHPQKDYWAIPGGYLEWDETIQECAIREVKEETGLLAKELVFGIIRSDKSAGDDRQNVDIIFFSEEFDGKISLSSSEVSKVKWYPVKELPEKMAFDHQRIIKEVVRKCKKD